MLVICRSRIKFITRNLSFAGTLQGNLVASHPELKEYRGSQVERRLRSDRVCVAAGGRCYSRERPFPGAAQKQGDPLRRLLHENIGVDTG
jgi:hypothetical protein